MGFIGDWSLWACSWVVSKSCWGGGGKPSSFSVLLFIRSLVVTVHPSRSMAYVLLFKIMQSTEDILRHVPICVE